MAGGCGNRTHPAPSSEAVLDLKSRGATRPHALPHLLYWKSDLISYESDFSHRKKDISDLVTSRL